MDTIESLKLTVDRLEKEKEILRQKLSDTLTILEEANRQKCAALACMENDTNEITAVRKQFEQIKHERNEAFKNHVDYLNSIANQIHWINRKWWHDADGKPLQINKGELLCLIHSEISEAMEGERKDLMDDKLPHRKMAEVEMADALIRIMDYCAGFKYDIAGAVKEKLEYNQTREDHKHESRQLAHGKKW